MKVRLKVSDVPNLDEIFLLTIPLAFLAVINALIAFYLWRHKQKVGEEASFLHLTLIFTFGFLLFIILSIGTLIEDLDFQRRVFALGNLVSWIIFMEITMAYLSAFLNRSRPWEKYFPVINGLSIASASLVFLRQDYVLDPEELGFYYLTLLVMFVIGINSVRRVNEIIPQVQNERNQKLLKDIRLGFSMSGIILAYIVISSFSWFLFKGITNFSLEITRFDLLDWIVWLNIPLVLIGLLVTLKIVKSTDFEKEVDIIEIMNLLDL